MCSVLEKHSEERIQYELIRLHHSNMANTEFQKFPLCIKSEANKIRSLAIYQIKPQSLKLSFKSRSLKFHNSELYKQELKHTQKKLYCCLSESGGDCSWTAGHNLSFAWPTYQ